MVKRTKVDLEVIGFWAGHPYRAELARFANGVTRERRRLRDQIPEIELRGKVRRRQAVTS